MLKNMEIERKFLIKEMPDLSGIKAVGYERYYIKKDGEAVERIQKKGDSYEYETKRTISHLEHEKEKRRITREEFEELKRGKENEGIIRDGYLLSSNPDVSIKIYHGRFEGLSRVEVEFSSKEEAEKYVPQSWMGTEITVSPLGADSRLLHLSRDEFLSLLKRTQVW
jgi:CYTH domain-containing protein